MGPEQFADIYWPTSKNELEFPWISDDGKGNLTLTPYPFDAGAMDVVRKAEAAYKDKKYDRAAGLLVARVRVDRRRRAHVSRASTGTAPRPCRR